MIKKPLKIEIEWEYLQRIAEFYKFPSAVFLVDKKNFPKSKAITRDKSLIKKADLYEKIKELVEKND